MTTTKINAWNKDTGEVVEFETYLQSVKQYGENGLILRDTNLNAVTQVINKIRYCVPCEFTINFTISFGDFCEASIWTFDGTIDITK